MGPQGKTGATGPRGRQGTRGPTGASGRRGAIGKLGHKGPRGFNGSLQKDEVLDRVVSQFDDVYQQLNAQVKRIAQMQGQVDLMSATLGRLASDTAKALTACTLAKR
jgi:collagen triple helix repeat protein